MFRNQFLVSKIPNSEVSSIIKKNAYYLLITTNSMSYKCTTFPKISSYHINSAAMLKFEVWKSGNHGNTEQLPTTSEGGNSTFFNVLQRKGLATRCD